jgi:hypothetical protein
MLIWYMHIEQRELYNHNETKAKFSVMVLNVICSNTFFSFLIQGASVQNGSILRNDFHL